MNKKTFVVSDTNREYVERFARCLSAWEDRRFDVHGFTEPEALAEYVTAETVDILLVGERMLEASPDFPVRLKAGCRLMLILSENRNGGGEIPVIYRYQPLDRMLRQIASCCEEENPADGTDGVPAAVYGIYSPVKRCYKTTFSLILGQILAERGAALYINLEDFTGLPALACDPGEETLSDILYCHRVGQPERRKLSGAVQNLGKLAYIPPVVCPGDIRETEPEEIAEVISEIGRMDAYESIVIDLGDALKNPVPVMRLCQKIYMPVREDCVSKAKLEAFHQILLEQKEEKLPERIRNVRLPSYSRMETVQTELRELRRSAFGRYVERMFQEENSWR